MFPYQYAYDEYMPIYVYVMEPMCTIHDNNRGGLITNTD